MQIPQAKTLTAASSTQAAMAKSSSSSTPFRSFDAFAKPIDGLRSKTAVGGTITLIAMSFASILFLSQLYMYLQLETRQSIRLARSYPLSVILPSGYGNSHSHSHSTLLSAHESHSRPDHVSHFNVNHVALQRNRLPIDFRITFPFIPCTDLHLSHDGATTSSSSSENTFVKMHGKRAFQTRVPTAQEYLVATYGASDGKEAEGHTFTQSSSLGCTLEGSFQTMRIGGDLTISLTPRAWDTLLSQIRKQLERNPNLTWKNIGLLYNMTHYIHHLDFGTHFHLASHHPFQNRLEVMDNPSGIAVVYHNIKIIPTQYRNSNPNLVQLSTATHVIQPETLEATNSQTLPGIVFHYDLSPLEVIHVETRENVLVFLSSLISIVGGVYILVGWMSQWVVDSASAVAKKRD